MDNNLFYRNVLENLYDGVYFVDKERRITFWNKGAERISGFDASEVSGSFCHDNLLRHVDEEGRELCNEYCPLKSTIEDGDMREAKVYLHHKNGHRVPVNIRSIAIYEGDEIVGAVEVFFDDSEKREMLEDMKNLESMAMKDHLTGLYNRRYTEIFLDSRMRELLMLDIPFGVAMMDIDKFKDFNDSHGHDVGDEILKTVTLSMNSIIRKTDLVSRWGGEEFLAVFSGIDEKSLEIICEKMRMLVEKSFLGGSDDNLGVTISIGATMAEREDTIDEILKRADKLLYESKGNGRNRVTKG
ncbi:PAS domain S-box-containing protein/diguanylate cyclase (GGDEF) domain-containing protein [Dethiosulfatibacter aminovorans DSM 17477]|uniref:PAS domain S-box-containing protein/diguanylate cyclase (GGDEF) domain-containing protein n=1 Tax=Dethiosulfatibacter aminovorans DSM 17477 TaxID=1121476 RepID=A0A1M6JW39_9FIRM|nr:sensor domain-containing diguanylate cyclase [Dethiosulfatibacter aminovorans]SHJ50905.1 PAS domain S-box-containing protein/diguanylate cyclase (GGDEF) domain-containing protein [Dethiosulfatibacter aminovorans DSM 17477]